MPDGLTAALVLSLVAALTGLATLAWLAVVAQRHPALHHRILLNLTDDRGAIRGIVVRARGDWIVLGHGEYLQPDGQQATLDGDVVIERRRVLFLQVVP